MLGTNVLLWVLIIRQTDKIENMDVVDRMGRHLEWSVWLTGIGAISGFVLMISNEENFRFAAIALAAGLSYLVAARFAYSNAVFRGLKHVAGKAEGE